MFCDDLDRFVELCKNDKEEILAGLARIRALRTAVNINTHFIILSSLWANSDNEDQEEDE